MTSKEFVRRFEWVMNYEPTWTLEFCSGIGLITWSIGALMTNDYSVTGTSLILPIFGLFFGPMRWLMLFRIRYVPRVTAAFFGSMWWAWLWAALVHRWGMVPGMGPLIAVFLLDFMTLLRFSVPCAREILQDLRKE